MPIVFKSGSLNLLEPSGPVQACNGIALPLPSFVKRHYCITTAVTINMINPLNAELNLICHLLALGAHYILHVGRIRVNAVAVDKR